MCDERVHCEHDVLVDVAEASQQGGPQDTAERREQMVLVVAGEIALVLLPSAPLRLGLFSQPRIKACSASWLVHCVVTSALRRG